MPLDDYQEFLIGQGLSTSTVRNYSGKIRRAAEWAAAHGTSLDELKPSQVRALGELWPKRNASRRQLRAALIHYWAMHGVAGPVKAIPVPARPTPRWRGLEDDAVVKLLGVARRDWPRGGVIYLGLYLGLRREEMATLRWRDFEPDLSWVTITGKGDRTRSLPVHDRLREVLAPQRWPGEWVFPGRLGGHISLTTVNNWVAAMGTESGLGHIYPHQLRHTSGGKVNDQTSDIYAAQGWLGHVRGWCSRHWNKWNRYGDPEHVLPRLDWPKEKLLLSQVEKTETCWLWTGQTIYSGYGHVTWAEFDTPFVHRIAYMLWVGPIPDGLEIDHLCSVRNCVNPDHLEAVTRRENNQRRWRRYWAEQESA